MNYRKKSLKAAMYAVAAALFYGISTPFSKILLEKSTPTLTAAFLYLGAGIGVGVMYLFAIKKEPSTARLTGADLPYVIGMVLLDICAPILMLWGIKLGNAANASLLGNFEIAATTVIALFIFHEAVSPRLWLAIALITVSSGILSFSGKGSFSFSVGSALVLCAAGCWGLENNCTRRISEKSAYQIVVIKGVGSGSGSLFTGLIIGERFPELTTVILIMLLGFVAYGLSIFTYIKAQSFLGAAKTSAFYALAPFIGSLFSFVFVRERPNLLFFIALPIMLAGTYFALPEKQDNSCN